jgi:hypothetical protein
MQMFLGHLQTKKVSGFARDWLLLYRFTTA